MLVEEGGDGFCDAVDDGCAGGGEAFVVLGAGDKDDSCADVLGGEGVVFGVGDEGGVMRLDVEVGQVLGEGLGFGCVAGAVVAVDALGPVSDAEAADFLQEEVSAEHREERLGVPALRAVGEGVRCACRERDAAEFVLVVGEKLGVNSGPEIVVYGEAKKCS